MSNLDKLVEGVVHVLDEKKGTEIAVFDVQENSALTDRAILVSANNDIHIKALSESVLALSDNPDYVSSDDLFHPPRVSGSHQSGWIVVDLNSILVHVMTDDIRKKYKLDSIYEARANTVEHI